jgi:hypothetical protein
VSGSDLYVGGDFKGAGSLPLNGVGRWDGRRWSALGEGVDGSVWAIAVSGPDIYIGGDFTRAGNVLANGIAKWNGRHWSAVGDGVSGCSDVQCSPAVYALAVSGDDVYAGGRFLAAGGTSAKSIAKWNRSRWSSLDDGVRTGSYDGVVRSLAIRGASVYAGGSFKSAGGIEVSNIAVWDGRRWSALGPGLTGGLEQVLALAVRGRDVLAGGNFSRAGTLTVSNAAVWNGRDWAALDIETNSAIQNIAADGNNVYFGGATFTLPSGRRFQGVVKWNGAWSGVGSGVGNGDYFSPVIALAIGEKTLFAGGGPFTLPSGSHRFAGR